MMNAEFFAVRLAEELAREGLTANPGPPAGEYGWKLRIEGVAGAIVVYTGKKGPRLVLTELQSPPPELEPVIRRAWEQAQTARRAPSERPAAAPAKRAPAAAILLANSDPALAGLPRVPTKRVDGLQPAQTAAKQPGRRAEARTPANCTTFGENSPAVSAAAAPAEPPAARPLKTAPSAGCVELWVDGSYVAARGRSAIGWAVLILEGERELYCATGTDVPAEARSQRNVAGEILAVRHGLSWCREHGIDAVSVYYDYEGLEAWVTGRWQARNPFTAAYASWVRESGVAVRWHKVRAHSGRSRNEQVDKLARAAAEAALASE